MLSHQLELKVYAILATKRVKSVGNKGSLEGEVDCPLPSIHDDDPEVKFSVLFMRPSYHVDIKTALEYSAIKRNLR